MFSALILALSTPPPADFTTFFGPLHYCAQSFSIDLAFGESVKVKRGPDFYHGALLSKGAGFGIYEGNFPQGGVEGERVAAPIGKTVLRMPKDSLGNSYLIETGLKFPKYVHVWGEVFSGSPDDYRLLKRLKFNNANDPKCTESTFR
ncbi:MAG: hypothetical protein ACREB1_06350 [Sphingomicrobium sp.]